MKSCMTMKTARTLLTAILLLGATAPPVRDAKPPVVAGVDRASPKDAAETLENGRILIGELGCASCHKADASAGIVPKKAPLLGDAGDRLQADWLRAWLADPAAVKPGTTMPHVLSGKGESVEPLVHYLMSLRADKPLPAWSGSPSKAKDLFALEVKARAQEAGINLAYPYHRWIDPQTLEVVYWQAALCGGGKTP